MREEVVDILRRIRRDHAHNFDKASMTNLRPLRILLADDHELVLAGLRMVLGAQKDWQICGEARNGQEAVAKAGHLKPDVVVMDFNMPVMNGLEATRRIRDLLPETEVLILTMHESGALSREALAVGARGFVLKTEANGQLVAAVKKLSEHRMSYSEEVLENALGSAQEAGAARRPFEKPHPSLTAREREVLRMVVAGKKSKEIADELKISVKTADVHRSNILGKLKLNNTADLVRYAIQAKLVDS